MEVEAGGEVVNRLTRGECFGETALLTGEARNATVRCSQPSCRLLSLDVAEFHKLVRRSKALLDALEGVAAARPVVRPASAAR